MEVAEDQPQEQPQVVPPSPQKTFMIEKGMFKGLILDMGRMPSSTDHALVTTYKERQYYASFHIFENCGRNARYSLDVRGTDNSRNMSHHGPIDKLPADLELIDICSMCHNPAFGCTTDVTMCNRCITDSCFQGYPVDECAICMKPLQGPPCTLETSPCFHIFHKWCLGKVRVKTRTYVPNIVDDDDMDGDTYEIRECPMCKSELRHICDYFDSE
jgi:hypothetical protein